MKRLVLGLISFYRRSISPLKGSPCCRFYPSCSAYTYRAVSEWGVFIGLFLGIFRILRCWPFFPGGYDPIPRKRRKIIPRSFGYISSDRFGRLLSSDRKIFYTF